MQLVVLAGFAQVAVQCRNLLASNKTDVKPLSVNSPR